MEIKDVELAKTGNKEVFEKIILENLDNLYRISYAITRHEEDGKDAVCNTVLKAYEKIHTLKKPEFFKTWLTKILINECNSILKKRKKVTYMEDIEILPQEENNTVSIAVQEVINSLGKNFKEIVILYYFDDFSTKEIAEILGIAEGTVKSRLARARDVLRTKLNFEQELTEGGW